ncbi:hypothetical protein RSOLAG22IIIB_03254 [Rhizoctonia solani]|uniref:Uncharacterized protein n=1 Tax=Rhizoctonia solani TaxID=456999 RepID=A0A0K6FPB3_9AGAM|nr:hypothetical protein RSOLAG22IIIB_03254 [Rhizoctonia solani]
MPSPAEIWESILLALFLIFRQIYPPPSKLLILAPAAASNNHRRRSAPLPQETLDHILSIFLTSLVEDLRCETVRDYRVQKKHLMQDVLVVARCSKHFHEAVFKSLGRIWASCGLDLCSKKKYPSASNSPARSVRIITAEQGCLPLNIDLSVHIMLEIASINYHNGIQWSNQQQKFNPFLCVRAYPRSLRQLELLHLHTPEEEVIKLVSDCCPALIELRLARCTLFNNPRCWYWRTHTRNQDHDYMRTYDLAAVVDYANHMALLLRRLPQLESIHIGHYLIGMDAVLTHRTDNAHKRYHCVADRMSHIDGANTHSITQLMANADEGPLIDPQSTRLADKALWATPCRQCEREFRKPIEEAERLAARIMAAHFKSLMHVSFANFLSGGRVSPSSWLVGRQQRGSDLYVRTEDPNRPRSRQMQPMGREGNRWVPL